MTEVERLGHEHRLRKSEERAAMEELRLAIVAAANVGVGCSELARQSGLNRATVKAMTG